VENVYVADNFSHFAIYLPNYIDEVLTKTKVHSFFETRCTLEHIILISTPVTVFTVRVGEHNFNVIIVIIIIIHKKYNDFRAGAFLPAPCS